MVDWVDHLTKAEAQAVLDAKVKTRYPARDGAGSKVMRYTAPTASELARIREKANAD